MTRHLMFPIVVFVLGLVAGWALHRPYYQVMRSDGVTVLDPKTWQPPAGTVCFDNFGPGRAGLCDALGAENVTFADGEVTVIRHGEVACRGLALAPFPPGAGGLGCTEAVGDCVVHVGDRLCDLPTGFGVTRNGLLVCQSNQATEETDIEEWPPEPCP